MGIDNREHQIFQCSSDKLPELKAWFSILDILLNKQDKNSANSEEFSHLYCRNLELRLVCDRILYVCDIDPKIISMDGLFSLTVLNLIGKEPAPCYLKAINNLV